MRLFTTEAVTKFHPDKYADQISDALVTAYMRGDRNSRCGIEALVKDNTVVLAGEVTSTATVDLESIVCRVARKLGYSVDRIINLISEQSPQIGQAVNKEDDIGAGDQGIVFGYATNGRPSKLPYSFDIANRIVTLIEQDVEHNPTSPLVGDGKTQVTLDLDGGTVTDIVVSVCHKEDYTIDEVRRYVRTLLHDIDPPDRWHINPAGTWTVGGPAADCGLTGRKIVCDQYGGACTIGGGALSGKDVSKVDRTGTYMARRIACELLDKFGLEYCLVQFGFVIGQSKPISITASGSDGLDYSSYVLLNYDLTVKGMIDYLDLYNKDFEKLAEGCHFYNKDTKTKKEKKHEIQEQKPSGSIQRRSPQDEPSGRCENGGALPSDRRCSVVERIEEAHQERQH